MRLIIKTVPCKQDNLVTSMGDTARTVVQQLLVALTLQNPQDMEQSKENAEQAASSTAVLTASGPAAAEESEPVSFMCTRLQRYLCALVIICNLIIFVSSDGYGC